MKYIFKLLTLVLLGFFIVSCGSGESSRVFSPNITVKTTNSTLNTQNKIMNIDLLLTNEYSSDVTVQVKDLALSVSPCEVLSSTFTPNEFTFDKKSHVLINAELIFVDECTPSNYELGGTTLLTLDGVSREVELNSKSKELNITTVDTVTTISPTTPIPEPVPAPLVPVEEVILPTIVIPTDLKVIGLTTNKKMVEIAIKVFNNITPYTEGTVKVELPSKVLTGSDVGLFESYEVPVNSQGLAIFSYTGPENLKALLEKGEISSTFKFYHTQNSGYKQELKVTYDIEDDAYVPGSYFLSIGTEDKDFSMGIPNLVKTFSVILKDEHGTVLTDDKITINKIEVTSENALVGQLVNLSTGEKVNSYLLKNENLSTFIVASKKLSGIVPIRINVDFEDLNKQKKTLSTVINIRIMSGLPSAISISYVSTGHDASRAKYEERFAISVTDEYGNKVNTKPYISLGAIIGYAVDGSEASSVETNNTKRLYYSKLDIEGNKANGTIDTLGDEIANTTNFEDITPSRSDVFKWVNTEGANSDKLVVFGKGKNYEAMGKWDFNKTDNNTLSLADDYFGKSREGLYYAIGHNYYQDQCQEDGREWLGSTDSETYQLDEEGTVVVSYKYDYHLTGKDALIWVNLNGYQSDTQTNTRIGEVAKHTLRGIGLESRPTNGYTILKGTTNSNVHFAIHHSTISEWYLNGHFAHVVEANVCASIQIVDNSNWYDARTCNNGGVAYITYEVTAPADQDCNFNITDVQVSKEF